MVKHFCGEIVYNGNIVVYGIYFRQLKQAREGVSHGGLGLLARHRRRQRIKAMLDIMKTLKTLVCLLLVKYFSLLAYQITYTCRP